MGDIEKKGWPRSHTGSFFEEYTSSDKKMNKKRDACAISYLDKEENL
jgi:hypothetical protein